MTQRFKISNSFVDSVNMEDSVSQAASFLEKNDRIYSIFAANPEKNHYIAKDPVLKKAMHTADLIIPDGIGMVVAVKIIHGVRISRVPGIELMARICEVAIERTSRVFLYGAEEVVNKTAANILKESYPKLQIAGRCSGFEKDNETVIRKINSSNAEILFIALGSPKQEKWFVHNKSKLKHVRLCQGVGGSLDVIAGKIKRAPKLWQKMSAEWLFRLITEPHRIKRQKALPIFCYDVILHKLKTYTTKGISHQ